jgi:hypothetical protein
LRPGGDVIQGDDHSLALGQAADLGAHQLGELAGLGGFGRTTLLVARVVCAIEWHGRDVLATTLPIGVLGDEPSQPEGEGSWLAQACEVAVGLQKCLLRDVLRELRVADARVRCREGKVLKVMDQCLKGVGIAALRGDHGVGKSVHGA